MYEPNILAHENQRGILQKKGRSFQKNNYERLLQKNNYERLILDLQNQKEGHFQLRKKKTKTFRGIYLQCKESKTLRPKNKFIYIALTIIRK